MLISGLAILSGAFLLWRQCEYRLLWPAMAASLGLSTLWWLLPSDFLMNRYSFHAELNDEIIYRHEGRNESILVLENTNGAYRSLGINGFSMSDTSHGAQRYMKLMAHLPLLIHEDPREALIIAYGVGNTAFAVSLHDSLEHIDVVDLSEDILSVSGYFEATNHRVLEHPKVRTFVNDGRHHLLIHEGRYDLITSEPPPLPFAHTVNLYTQDYYELIRGKLTEHGFFTQWLPIYQLNQDVVRSAVKAFVNVFPHSILISGYRSNLILMGSPGSFEFDLPMLRARIDSNIGLKQDLQAASADDLTELVGAFVMGERGLAEYTANAAPVSDDHPTMEYSKSIHYRSPQDPRVYDGMAEVWDYLDETQVPFLEDYLALMEISYHQTAYLEGSGAWMERATVEAMKRHYQSLRVGGYRSGYLEHFLGVPLVQELMK
jgi:spermidine synthase